MPVESKITLAVWTNSKRAHFHAGCMPAYSARGWLYYAPSDWWSKYGNYTLNQTDRNVS